MTSAQAENNMAVVPLQPGGVSEVVQVVPSFNLESDIAHFVKRQEGFLYDIKKIVNKCQETYVRVIIEQFETTGLIFITPSGGVMNNDFILSEEALEIALQKASAESIEMLKTCLKLSAFANDDLIFAALKEANEGESNVLRGTQRQLQNKFIQTHKTRCWHDFLQSLTTNFHYIFLNSADSRTVFYSQTRMQTYIAESIEKCTQQFADQLGKIGILTSNAEFVAFSTLLSKASGEILEKNLKKEGRCRNDVKSLMQNEFHKALSKLDKMISTEPLLFKNGGDIKALVIDDLKMNCLKSVNKLSKDMCMDNSEDFYASFIEDYNAMTDDLVKKGVIILNRWRGTLNPIFKNIKAHFFNLTQTLCKDLPESVRNDLQKRFMGNVMGEYMAGGFYSEAELTPPTAAGTSSQGVVTVVASQAAVVALKKVTSTMVSPSNKTKPVNEDANGSSNKRVKLGLHNINILKKQK